MLTKDGSGSANDLLWYGLALRLRLRRPEDVLNMMVSRHGELEREEAGEVAHELAGEEDRENDDMKLRGRNDNGEEGLERGLMHIAARVDAISAGDRDIERAAIRGDARGDARGDVVGGSYAAASSGAGVQETQLDTVQDQEKAIGAK